MATKTEIDAKFGIITPDQVAECWNGVLAVDGLYEALWGCVDKYKAPTPEESEEPCYGMDCVADFWKEFSPAHQEALIRLEAANRMEY